MSKRLILSALLVGLVVGTLIWYGGALVRALADTTKYSPDYSETAFTAIQEGMSHAEVVQLLGQPLVTAPHKPEVIRWYGPPGTTVNDEGGLQRPEGTNRALAAIITFDPSGQQALAGRSEFVGLSAETIRGLLGEPIKQENRLSVSYWYYSQSPTGASYHRRWIGFDAAGKVVEKIAYFYWD